jgi:hypothetical protein
MSVPVHQPLTAVRRAVDTAALGAWIAAGLRGGSSSDHIIDAGARVGLRRVLTSSQELPLVLAVGQLRAEGLTGVRLVLPAPGDAAGLPGPPALNQRAIEEGAAIIMTAAPTTPGGPGKATVLVPSQDGQWPTYQVPLPPAVSSGWPTLRGAQVEFTSGVAGHSAALAELDVAADARGLRDVVLTEDDQPLPPLPPGLSDAARELLGRARLVALLAAAGIEDSGSAVSAAEASSRAAHLRALAGIARRAMAAAVSSR